MKIQDQAYVEIYYKLCLDSGKLIDQTRPGQPYGFVFNVRYLQTAMKFGQECP